jgi:acyl-[acyl-carrier-protein]-phospholipid O-acyltransferase/long-chain-fatty-acid--[acyl-carrier-protein] ligase
VRGFFARLIFGTRYRLTITGAEQVPKTGPVLLLGNHISWIDFIFLQWALPRTICFVMHAEYYDWPVLRTVLRWFSVISIQPTSSRGALKNIVSALEDNKAIGFFPEGFISVDGEFSPLMRGFEKILKETDTEVAVVPFAINNMWGDILSLAPRSVRKQQKFFLRRPVGLSFGPRLGANATRAEVAHSISRMLK